MQNYFFWMISLSLLFFFAAPNASAQETSSETSWMERVKFSGDFRIRQDYSKKEASNPNVDPRDPERFRSRIRLRLGADVKLNDNVNVISQFVTADSPDTSATSGNQTLTNAGEKKVAYFDLAYVNIHTEEFEFNAGKMKNPIYRAGGSELLWDADFTPEGASAKYSLILGGTKLDLLAYGFWMKERNNGTAPQDSYTDSGTLGGQIVSRTEMEWAKLAVYIGSNDFTNLKDKPALRDDGFGNSVTGADDLYVSNYHVLNAGLNFALTSIPLEIYVDAAQNTGVKEQSKATLAGINFGKLKESGDWMVGYNWRESQKDSTFGGLQDSDFADGELNSRGHGFIAGYAFTESIQSKLTVYQAQLEIDADAKDYTRAMLDFLFKF